METEKPDLKPIGKREVKSFFTSEEFLKRLARAADINWMSDHETSFVVGRNSENQYVWGKVVGEDPDGSEPWYSVGNFFNRSLLDNNNYDVEDFYTFVALHFHPPLESFDPSPGDFQTAFALRELSFRYCVGHCIDSRPLMCIGSVPRANRNIELLVMQETGKKALGMEWGDSVASFIEMDPEYRHDDNEGIVEILNKQSRLQAEILHYDMQDGGSYKLRSGEYNGKLGKFSSKPVYLGYNLPLDDELFNIK
jgi:hypothetical protein